VKWQFCGFFGVIEVSGFAGKICGCFLGKQMFFMALKIELKFFKAKDLFLELQLLVGGHPHMMSW
jgi:hypothetical protein